MIFVSKIKDTVWEAARLEANENFVPGYGMNCCCAWLMLHATGGSLGALLWCKLGCVLSSVPGTWFP